MLILTGNISPLCPEELHSLGIPQYRKHLSKKRVFSILNDVHETLETHISILLGLIFVCQEPAPESMASDCLFGLLALELGNIRPNYEAMVRAGHLKPTDLSGSNGIICNVRNFPK